MSLITTIAWALVAIVLIAYVVATCIWTASMAEYLKTVPFDDLIKILNKGHGSWGFRSQCRTELQRRHDESIWGKK